MPRTPQPEAELPFLDELMAVGEAAPSIDRKLELLGLLRTNTRDGGRQLDRLLLERLKQVTDGLLQAQRIQQELRELVERQVSPPWRPALFLRAVPTELGPRAMVLSAGSRSLVGMADGITLESLRVGEEVFLGVEGTVIAGRSPYGTPQCGETAFFEQLTADGRCVLRWRDEEVVVDPAGALDASGLKHGDQVRWDRTAWIAFEKIGASTGRQYLLEDVPTATRSQVGGQETNLETLLSALTAALVAPGTAALYGLGGRQTILMVGPPGCAKTLMARVGAAEVTRLGGRRCRFAVVKPAEWESPYVGETEANIRNCFRALREEADGSVVLFLDEIESVGRTRGGMVSHHADRFLAALLAEIDGFAEHASIAIIAATNRKDLVDPALLERLSDIEIAVGRPDMRGARAIFDIHFTETLPVVATETREDIIETAVSRLYGPNSENALSTLRFRDGTTRTVVARDLASGRLFAQICRAACRSALRRHLRTGDQGVRVADMEHALSEALERLATTLTRHNVHAHLADLPQDVDVVSVEPVVRRVARPHVYRHAA